MTRLYRTKDAQIHQPQREVEDLKNDIATGRYHDDEDYDSLPSYEGRSTDAGIGWFLVVVFIAIVAGFSRMAWDLIVWML